MVKFHQTEASSLLSELSLLSVRFVYITESQRRGLLYTSYIFSSSGLVAIGLNVRERKGKKKKNSFSLLCVLVAFQGLQVLLDLPADFSDILW